MKMRFVVLLFLSVLAAAACERPDPQATIVASLPTAIVPVGAGVGPRETAVADAGNPQPKRNTTLPPTPATNQSDYVGTPTPDPPRALPTYEASTIVHTVTAGETLGYIAQLYGSKIEEIQTINGLTDQDFLAVGQQLRVPQLGPPEYISPDFKIIPDSELVYGPAAKSFDVRKFVAPYGGYLLQHGEEVEGQWLEGPEIVSLVAHRFSVHPRLLLAMLEYRSGWVTRAGGVETAYPLGYVQARNEGLYRQLSWAANQLNWGFYGRNEGGMSNFYVGGELRFAYAPTINDGTAGVQHMLGANEDATYEQWLHDVGPSGLFATYRSLFGNPFAYTVAPLWPSDLRQPPLALPWAADEGWYYTGGPHGGWAQGSAWAALDFVPPGERLGCVQTDYWVRAMAAGIVVRSDLGAVVVDLDGDGFAGTGWAITYMHLEKRDRIPVGTKVQTGDPLGHPSCEGGFSNGTHVHIARTYNGRWVAADGPIPFRMGGWVSEGTGREYDGRLVKGDVVKEACECRDKINHITIDP